MAASHQQGNDHLKFISNSPCFFKIILQDTIQNGKLKVCEKPWKYHVKPCKLRVPSGAAWKVELTKCGGKIWFENGWLEFSNHYSLELGHLLVFRYDGNSNFHVIIFDRTASEIQYPYTSNNQRQSNEIPKQNINESKTECNGKSGFLAQQVSHNGCPAVKGDKRTNHPVIQRMRGPEKVKALEKAINTFKSKNPFFLVVMQRYYVGLSHSRGCRLLRFVFQFGKAWIVTFKHNQTGKKQISVPRAGWGTFVRDNNIQAGDVCAFKLCHMQVTAAPNHRLLSGRCTHLLSNGWRRFSVDNNLEVGDACVFELIEGPKNINEGNNLYDAQADEDSSL
ncbi:hypothetical protein Gotri_023593, partial [Gossypium trilobum]|nr:hypothetical protein [Gossypium trilobum]